MIASVPKELAKNRTPSWRPPAVERLLAHPAAADTIARYGRTACVDAIRATLAEIRTKSTGPATETELLDRSRTRLDRDNRPSLRPVFNLTGTVLHTNLGRALLPAEAVEAVKSVMTFASNLEYDLDDGTRGERDDHVSALVCRLTGAEAAVVVNNNAAAVLLVLNALAMRREVIVSRGELVEIGGSFRIPDVMSRAGCRLREVGTTNRTHLTDFSEAIGSRTGLVMKVHPSNYAIHGFTAEADEAALGSLCAERGVPFAIDLGSGNLIDFTAYGLPTEPTVRATLAHSDLVTFSGDKLLGSVQCGIVAGRRDLIERIRRNPLKRALRVDKMTYAALEATLRLYLNPERLIERLPTLRLLARTREAIEAQARRLLPLVTDRLGANVAVTVEACASQIGSGALPIDALPSACLAFRPPRDLGRKTMGVWPNRFADCLRDLPVPIIGRTTDGALRLDLRTLEDETAFLAQIDALKLPR